MKLLGLDVGDKRVGVAFADVEMRLATPVDVFVRVDFQRDVERIAGYARDYGVDKIVAGLPRNTDGTLGSQAQAAQSFAERVAATLGLPVVMWDEHLTTVEASLRSERDERPAGKTAGRRRGKKTRRTLDDIAAAIILQDYMNAQADTSGHDAA